MEKLKKGFKMVGLVCISGIVLYCTYILGQINGSGLLVIKEVTSEHCDDCEDGE